MKRYIITWGADFKHAAKSKTEYMQVVRFLLQEYDNVSISVIYT